VIEKNENSIAQTTHKKFLLVQTVGNQLGRHTTSFSCSEIPNNCHTGGASE
jgi:hypothetical protein